MTVPRGVLFVSGSAASATLRYRVRQAEELLRAAGARTAAVHITDRRAGLLADAADVVVLYRCPAGAELLAMLRRLRERLDPPLVTYDVDDLVFRADHVAELGFLESFDERQRTRFERDVRLREQLVPLADVVTGSTAEVLAELAQLTDAPAALLPNGVGHELLRRSDAALARERHGGGFRIGYFSGSATHDDDWGVIEPAVLEVLRSRPDAQLWLVGKVAASPALDVVGDRVRVIPYVAWTELPALLRAVDVTLAPLAPSRFTEAKSAIKWLEAALVQTPTVATPTGPFRVAVEPGRTGYLAATHLEWVDTLLLLADDAGLRADTGAAARAAALESYGPQVQSERLFEVLGRRPEPGRGRSVLVPPQGLPRTWQVAPLRLEQYPFAPAVAGLVLRPPPSRRPALVAVESAARVGEVARRGNRAVRTRLARVARLVRG